MPRFERLDSNSNEQKHLAMIQAFEKGRAILRAQETGEMNIVIGSSKHGIDNIGIIVDKSGRSLHMVNAVSASKIPLSDAAKTSEYPDIIIGSNNFNLETIIKKFSEFLFLKLQLQDLKINAYKNAKSFQANKPLSTFDPNTGVIKTAA